MPLSPPIRDLYAKANMPSATAPRVYAETQSLGYVERPEKFQTTNMSAAGMAFIVLTCHGLTKGSHAVKGAVNFAKLEYMCSPGVEVQAPRLGDGPVLDGIAKMVEGGKREVVALDTGDFDRVRDLRFGPDRSLPHEVRFCLNPLTVEFVWPPLYGHAGRTDVYAPFRNDPAFPNLEPGLIERWAKMPWAFFVAAGRAWLELQRQHGASLPLSTADPALPDAATRKANAATLPGAAALTRDQDRNGGSGPLTNPDRTAGAENAQAESARKLGHTLHQPRGVTYGQSVHSSRA